jgi:hypothetical protein
MLVCYAVMTRKYEVLSQVYVCLCVKTWKTAGRQADRQAGRQAGHILELNEAFNKLYQAESMKAPSTPMPLHGHMASRTQNATMHLAPLHSNNIKNMI